MAQNKSRIVYHDTFEGKGFTDENSLANALLTKPDQIDPVITHLLGKESDRFPLSFLSEGQKGGSVGINDVQYTYDVINRINRADVVVSSTYTSGDTPGFNFQPFFVVFQTNWLKLGHTVESEDGTTATVIGRRRHGVHYIYELEMAGADPSAFCPLSQLVAGTKWAMVGGANVAESRSMGNESNVVAPGKMKNQLSFLRKSYRLAGNISNKTVECQFNINGKPTRLWMAWEQWQHLINWKVDLEEHCWYAKYNRLPNGEILKKDRETGLPIPVTAGILEQVPNQDTYSTLTFEKLKNTVRDVMYGATDTGSMDIVLYTGTGGCEEFDEAMKDKASGFTQIIGDKFVTGSDRNLVLGGYFTQYQHVDGHVITVKKMPLLDHGNRALKARLHPRTGLPITSYDMYFIDQSIYDGKRNLIMLHQNGRSMITGVLKGMAPTPMNFAGNNVNVNLATERDESSIHFMCSKSPVLRRNTHSFVLTCDLT